MGQSKDARRNHQRRMGQPTPKAPESPATLRLRHTLRTLRTADAPRPETPPRPQRRPHRLARVLTSVVQSASRSPQSTSDPALRQTTPPYSLRRSPLVSHRFLRLADELTGNPSSSEPTRFRLPLTLRFFVMGTELTGTSAPIYLPRKKPK
jgi:hypothetical protein